MKIKDSAFKFKESKSSGSFRSANEFKYQLKAHIKDQLPKTSEFSSNDSEQSKLLKIKDSAIKSKATNDSSPFISPQTPSFKGSKIKSNFSQFVTSQVNSMKTSAIKSKATNNFSQFTSPEKTNLKESKITSDFSQVHK